MGLAHLIEQIRSSWLGGPPFGAGGPRSPPAAAAGRTMMVSISEICRLTTFRRRAIITLPASSFRVPMNATLPYCGSVQTIGRCLCGGRVPDAITQVQLLPVLRVWRLPQRGSCFGSRAASASISIDESFKACTIAWSGGCTTRAGACPARIPMAQTRGQQYSHYDYGCDLLHDASPPISIALAVSRHEVVIGIPCDIRDDSFTVCRRRLRIFHQYRHGEMPGIIRQENNTGVINGSADGTDLCATTVSAGSKPGMRAMPVWHSLRMSMISSDAARSTISPR